MDAFLPWSFQANRGYVAIDVWAQVQEEKVLIISRESVDKSEDMEKGTATAESVTDSLNSVDSWENWI